MRWFAIGGSAAVIGIAVGIMDWLPSKVLPPLTAILVLLLIFNITIHSLLKANKLPKQILQTQAYVDLIALLVMIHFAGGLENPLYILALIHVIIAGIVLTPRRCYMVAATAALLLALISWLEWSGYLSHYTLAVIPHGHIHNMHYSKDAGYVSSVLGIFTCALFLAAYFTTKITSQTRADETRIRTLALQKIESQKILEQALETTSTAIRVLDRGGIPKWKNQIWDNWFPDGLEPFAEASEAERQTFEERNDQTIEVRAEASPEDRCGPSDPETDSEAASGGRCYRITFAAIEEKGNDMLQIVELATDITREMAEQSKMIRTGQLVAVGRLASQVAHEVNNPITIMGAKARLLLSKFPSELPDKVVYDLEKIVELSDRVAQIAKGLLSYSRPSPKQRCRLDLRQPVQGSLELVRQQLLETKVETEIALPESPCYVDGNEGELSQVFLNLFMNAMDAMPGGGNLSVSMDQDSRSQQPGFAVRVSDDGSGIPPDILERIFVPFFTTKDVHKGTGLGLSICYGLVSSHGGVLDVESKPGHGTTFGLWLPAVS